MANRVRYYITENDDRAVVRSVPVTVSTQPANQLMEFEQRSEAQEKAPQQSRRVPVGRIVKVLRKPADSVRA
jgi:hypothetical protein